MCVWICSHYYMWNWKLCWCSTGFPALWVVHSWPCPRLPSVVEVRFVVTAHSAGYTTYDRMNMAAGRCSHAAPFRRGASIGRLLYRGAGEQSLGCRCSHAPSVGRPHTALPGLLSLSAQRPGRARLALALAAACSSYSCCMVSSPGQAVRWGKPLGEGARRNTVSGEAVHA